MIKNDNVAYLVKRYRENRLSHIFLVETDNTDMAMLDLKELIKIINCEDEYKENCSKCNICHLIDTEMLPSFKVIDADGQAIKKQQMLDLKQEFATMPSYSKYNVYIVKDANKFNASSANTCLKFIEEPEDNIIGFLITNNKENVINTIKSRCEVIKAFYDTKQEKNDRVYELALSYLKKIEIEKLKSIVYNRIVINEKLSKDEVLLFFKYILDIYLNVYKGINVDDLDKLNSLSKQDILKRINLVNEMILRLNYNVNINLLLDNFVLELEEL